jgi:hypothetical protein
MFTKRAYSAGSRSLGTRWLRYRPPVDSLVVRKLRGVERGPAHEPASGCSHERACGRQPPTPRAALSRWWERGARRAADADETESRRAAIRSPELRASRCSLPSNLGARPRWAFSMRRISRVSGLVEGLPCTRTDAAASFAAGIRSGAARPLGDARSDACVPDDAARQTHGRIRIATSTSRTTMAPSPAACRTRRCLWQDEARRSELGGDVGSCPLASLGEAGERGCRKNSAPVSRRGSSRGPVPWRSGWLERKTTRWHAPTGAGLRIGSSRPTRPGRVAATAGREMRPSRASEDGARGRAWGSGLSEGQAVRERHRDYWC